jgi:acyl carrier protein
MKTIEFLEILDEIFEEDPGTVKPEDELSNYSWDSLAVVTLIAAIDNQVGLILVPESLGNATSVSDLIALVSEKIKD